MENRRYTITVTVHDSYNDEEKSTVFLADEFHDSVNTNSYSNGDMDFYVQESEITLQLTNYQKKKGN